MVLDSRIFLDYSKLFYMVKIMDKIEFWIFFIVTWIFGWLVGLWFVEILGR